MKILVVGNGAREDALSWRLSQSPSCTELFAAPGNAGTASRGTNWHIPATDGKSLLARAIEERIELVVIGPETAIAAGVADRFREAKIPTFGPNRAPGRLESSKIFAKRFMERNGIPTAKARVVHSLSHAEKALADWRGGCVVKADGLAAGKGVVVAPDAQSALAVLRDWYGGGGVPGGGSDVLLEEKLAGREVSVFAVGDGKRFVDFGAACDYKRAGDGDTGPNTGGMGAYSPPAGFPADLHEIVRERVLDPVMRGLAAENERFVGVLYCGLMWTANGTVRHRVQTCASAIRRRRCSCRACAAILRACCAAPPTVRSTSARRRSTEIRASASCSPRRIIRGPARRCAISARTSRSRAVASPFGARRARATASSTRAEAAFSP